jgi:hypothetical protein
MRRIDFIVRGMLPPKKDGARSMWGKNSERHRLIALRRAALESLGGQPPFERDIRITVEIHDRPQRISFIGDLDNFITGICVGLMSAAPRASRTEDWEVDTGIADIGPSRCIAIRDDRHVVEIAARKLGDDSSVPWYAVTLEGA